MLPNDSHAGLCTNVSRTVNDFYEDLKEHNASDNVLLLVFTEFGRRVHDNGSGTDHGSGGAAFVIGDGVKGGLYGEYPSLEEDKQFEGTCNSTMTSVGFMPRSSKTGWDWIQNRSLTAASRNSILFLKASNT
ncbi:MAG: hypothetical protein CM1200mP35_07850 [Chloroflexota bacterium]|nr:MAG: hypothetical protein CM1200mP35_07850 [Chloroflexota bacterium]